MKILQSTSWWIEKDLKWIIDNADFIFWDHYDNRPYIVTNKDICSCNCFKLDINKYGVSLNSYFKYDPDREKYMFMKSYNVKEGLLEFIFYSGEEQIISPSKFSVMISNIFRGSKRKDEIIEI